MFKSKEGNDSQFLNNVTLPRLSETCNGLPKITSTPLNSHVAPPRRNKGLSSPTHSKQGTPRRYSLSEVSPSPSRTKANMNGTHSPGPLLASLDYKDNISMYEETRSSGLARRIVLYNEETELEKQPTHQEKYNTLGLFPIVHLFKKKVPLLEQSPKRVKIKLSSPEYLRNYSPQHRNKVLEEITKPRFQRQHSLPLYGQTNETDTKSVLEALKEISRKRIHSNEEHDLPEDSGKRIRTELSNGSSVTSKRCRADSPLLDSSGSPPTKQSQKKFCVYDEFAASKSSSDFSFLKKSEPLRSKRKTISTSTESLLDSKQVKVVNVETQTQTAANENKSNEIDESIVCEVDIEKPKQIEPPIKVFDDAPLERIRKSRLAALMGNLAGKDAVLLLQRVSEPKPKEPEKSVEVSKENITTNLPKQLVEEKSKVSEEPQSKPPLVSILSPPRSTKESSPIKHVQFSVSTAPNSPFSQPSLTQTSGSVIAPIVSDSISKPPIYNPNKQATDISFPVSSSAETKANSEPTPSLVPPFSFGNSFSARSETNIGTNPLNTTSSSFSKPLQTPTPISSIQSESTPKTPSPQKMGGFKFDLKIPTSSVLGSPVPKSTAPTLSISSPALTTSTFNTALTTKSSSFTFSKPSESKKESNFSAFEPHLGFGGLSKSPSFNFGPAVTTTAESKSQIPKPTIEFSFGSAANNPKFGNESNNQTSITPTFGATTTTTNVTNIASASPFSITTSSSGFGTGMPAFGAITTTTNSAFGDGQHKPSPAFTFGGSTPVTSSSAFGTKPTPMFGAGNAPSNTPAFGATNVASPSFGTTPTNLTFGNVPTTSAPTFAPAFGSSQVAKPPGFGNTPPATTASVFGSTPATSAPVFGSSSTAFGSTSTPGFKSPTTTTASAFGSSQFGSNPTTTTSIFGAADNKSSAFGSSNVFGATTQAPTFGSSTQPTSLFGSSTKPANPPPYGSGSPFSSITTTIANTTSGFGTSTSAPTFSFGSNKPANPNPFGGSTTTTASTFGTSGAFSTTAVSSSGFSSSAPAFGSATPAPNTFGVTSAPAFGQTDNKPAFAFGATDNTKTSSVFGSGSGTSAFGKPASNPQSAFMSPTSSFGSSSTTAFSTQQTNGGFNFGSNAAAPPAPAPFAFGAASGNNEPAKSSFNFTGGAANPPAFGSTSSAPAFGAATPNFGTAGPAFAATAPQATGVFNIGAGSATTGRPRTQLRAKRRT